MTQKSSQVLLQVEGMVAPARAETVARVLEGRAGVLAVPVAQLLGSSSVVCLSLTSLVRCALSLESGCLLVG